MDDVGSGPRAGEGERTCPRCGVIVGAALIECWNCAAPLGAAAAGGASPPAAAPAPPPPPVQPVQPVPPAPVPPAGSPVPVYQPVGPAPAPAPRGSSGNGRVVVGGVLVGLAVLLMVAAVVLFLMASGANKDTDDSKAEMAALAEQEAAANALIDPAMDAKLAAVTAELDNMFRASDALVSAENEVTAAFELATKLYNSGDTAGADAVITQSLPRLIGVSTEKLNAETRVAETLRASIEAAEGS